MSRLRKEGESKSKIPAALDIGDEQNGASSPSLRGLSKDEDASPGSNIAANCKKRENICEDHLPTH
jgi:hypothetical protein